MLAELPSALYGCEFVSGAALPHLERVYRRWGRRVLRWPRGAPGAAVLGTLGWWRARDWMIRRQFSLVARLMAIRFAARSAIASVLRYARSQPSSWLARQLVEMPRQGVPSFDLGRWFGCAPRDRG